MRNLSSWKKILVLFVFVGLSACGQQSLNNSSLGGTFEGFGTLDDLPTDTEPDQQVVSSRPTAQLQQSGISSFIGTRLANQLNSEASKKALDAQFFALQFGRPGAPRRWSGGGASGSVTVGPFVRINNLDCRDYTHIVKISGEEKSAKGTACRDGAGNWQTTNVRLS